MSAAKKPSPKYVAQALAYNPHEFFAFPDLSHWRKQVDMRALADVGFPLIVLKGPSGYGWNDVDKQVYVRAPQVLEAGAALGIYPFAYPSKEPGDAVKEAEFCARVFDKVSKICGVPKATSVVPLLDIEENKQGMGVREMTDWILTWVEWWQVNRGEGVILYTDKGKLKRWVHAKELEAHMGLWIAGYPYGGIKPSSQMTGVAATWDGRGFDAWQFSSSAQNPAVRDEDGIPDGFDISVGRRASPYFKHLFEVPLVSKAMSHDTQGLVNAVAGIDTAIAHLEGVRKKLLAVYDETAKPGGCG